MKEIIALQPLVDSIALSLQSSFIENEANGNSLFIVSATETAKTSLIFLFKGLDFCSYYDEITQKKMIDEFLPLVKVGQKKTLLIPDLLNCVEKQKSTRDQFLNTIKSGIDDTGIVRISTPHKQLDFYKLIEGLKFNMITATTSGNFLQIRKTIRNSGLLSRYMLFSYKYPPYIIKAIFKVIEGDGNIGELGLTIPKIKTRNVKISDNPKLFSEFEFISAQLGLQYEGYGFRAQTGLQRLAKANAIISNRKEVTKDDIDKIMTLSTWLNDKFSTMS